MNGSPRPATTPDPTLRALVERGLAQVQAREAAAAPVGPPSVLSGRVAPAKRIALPPRALGLASDRACVETNLARKGLWRSASAQGGAGGELIRLLGATDQLGLVQRIDAGLSAGGPRLRRDRLGLLGLARAG
jgi:hypothetical protein